MTSIKTALGKGASQPAKKVRKVKRALLHMTLEEIYLDYVNNFLTTYKMAEHYGISRDGMLAIIIEARELRNEVYG